MAERGWYATGLLRPLWQSYPGKREGLADAVGTAPETLSSINTGKRRLGKVLGRRLAEALDVSLLELGAPLREPDPGGETLLERLDVFDSRLESVEAQLVFLASEVDRVVELLSGLASNRSGAGSATPRTHRAR